MKSLQRFLDAQEDSYPRALAEIRAGSKQSHWMWYIFPQLEGLGKTDIAKHYGITGLQEATSYLQHPVLGKRLIEISEALLELESNDARAVMGKPDDLKLRSSMTLFSQVENAPDVFTEVIAKFYNGEKDELTLEILSNR